MGRKRHIPASTNSDRSGCFGWEDFHGEGEAFAGTVDFQVGDVDWLVDQYHRRGIADNSMGKLADMNEAILLHPEMDKSYGIHHHTIQDHAQVDLFDELRTFSNSS